jgi:large subunit ribosomal protein L17
MRHKKRGRKLSRTSAHRKATRRNIARALLEHERIVTTPAKAKETRSFVERLITLARKAQPFKDDPENHGKYLHYYRQAMKKLQDEKLVQKLFGEGPWRDQECLGERYADRPSGQTRIIKLSGHRLGTPLGYSVGEIAEFTYEIGGNTRRVKLTGNRLGDNAEQVIFELVGKTSELVEEELKPVIEIDEEETGVENTVEDEPDTEASTEEEEEIVDGEDK